MRWVVLVLTLAVTAVCVRMVYVETRLAALEREATAAAAEREVIDRINAALERIQRTLDGFQVSARQPGGG